MFNCLVTIAPDTMCDKLENNFVSKLTLKERHNSWKNPQLCPQWAILEKLVHEKLNKDFKWQSQIGLWLGKLNWVKSGQGQIGHSQNEHSQIGQGQIGCSQSGHSQIGRSQNEQDQIGQGQSCPIKVVNLDIVQSGIISSNNWAMSKLAQ